MDTASLHLLLVDDDQDLGEAFTQKLERAGFKVTFVSNGHTAERILKETTVDVVLTDISMESGDGIELIEAIRENVSPVPLLIFISGMSGFTMQDAHQIGAATFFPKPVDFSRLVSFIRKSLPEKKLA